MQLSISNFLESLLAIMTSIVLNPVSRLQAAPGLLKIHFKRTIKAVAGNKWALLRKACVSARRPCQLPPVKCSENKINRIAHFIQGWSAALAVTGSSRLYLQGEMLSFEILWWILSCYCHRVIRNFLAITFLASCVFL